jgi:hypothetical protein
MSITKKRKTDHNSHKSITTEQVAKLTDTLTRADIEGFARTLEALRSNEAIPERLRINLSESLDEICKLDAAGDTDQLSPRFLMVWLPPLLNVSDPLKGEFEANDSPMFPVTDALRDALDADAKRCCRSPHNQVIAILETYFDLNDCRLKGSNKGGKR